jgi:hypothetical protein
VDSVTVGERFRVTHEFAFPDTLHMLPPGDMEMGKSRVVSLVWSEDESGGTTIRRADMTMITLDLEGATIPERAFDFVTPAGDTLRTVTREVAVPVRFMAADTASLKPLKEQWEAPRNVVVWIAGAAGLIALALLAWWLWRRRATPEVGTPAEPALPADYTALTELSRIEKLGLLEREEFKAYYTLVVDAVRRYLEARYTMEAMDRTTMELLDDMNRRGIGIEPLEPLLNEADLVKFARFTPSILSGEASMHAARQIVVTTAPRRTPGIVPDGETSEAVG